MRRNIAPGDKFGFLTIIRELELVLKKIPCGRIKHLRQFECVCICGSIRPFFLNDISGGNTKSCGCRRINKKTGEYIEFVKTPEEAALKRVWSNMMARCYRPAATRYKNYGGNGVVVCEEWYNSFSKFYNWSISNGWKKGLELDKDIKGDGKLYSPETCCFVTPKENSNNRVDNIYVFVKGVRMTLANACRLLNIRYSYIWQRKYRGMTLQEAIDRPINRRK